MGGTGSGKRWLKKQVVESCNWIDTATLNKRKLLVLGTTDCAGALEWRNPVWGGVASVGYVLTVGPTTGKLRLQYGLGQPAEVIEYTVRLVATPCHMGGVRWWFLCPLSGGVAACGRRVRRLYFRGRYFGCRHCHGLAYRSSQRSDSRVYALARGGLGAIGDPTGCSVAQLGVMLWALELVQKRLDRFD